MRLILSRKGFDSSIGGVASPVFADGCLLSLPIPLPSAPLCYGDIAGRGEPIGRLVEALTRGRVRASDKAHLDPDLNPEARPRLPGWRPAFGQLAAAQTHLAAQGVGPGDLFLFFGWFRRVEAAGLRYLAGAPDAHVIFGWLQVGAVLAVDDRHAEHRRRHPWLAEHPHLNAHGVRGNTVYVAADRLVIDGRDMGQPGGGVFPRYHDALRLSADGGSRSRWRLPGWLHPARTATLSYHAAPHRWTEDGDTCLLASVAQGQGFVAAVPEARLADWLETMFADPARPAGLSPDIDASARRG